MQIHEIHFVRKRVSDPLHVHSKYREVFEFHFCTAGEAHYRFNNVLCPFHRGAICLAGPNDAHQIVIEDDQPVSFYYVMFTGTEEERKVFQRLHRRFMEEKYFVLADYSRQFFDRLQQKLETGDWGAEAAKHMLWTLIYDVLDCKGNRDRKHIAVDKAVALMQHTVDQTLTLDELAAETGLNKSYFSRLFKDEMGMPPLRYFNKLKIDMSCYLLKENHASIAEIAQSLGFYDEYHFNKVFKRFTKTTPGRYRKEHEDHVQ